MKYFNYLLILFVVSVGSVVSSAARDKVPVLVELFTAEGCSSCPAADKYLQKLIDEQPVEGVEIIGLSEHVDYWNQYGWTDPFSSTQFSNRQKYYAVFFKRTDIYTPQFIVDGTHEVMVKDGYKPLAEIAKQPKGNIDLKIESAQTESVSFKVRITDLPPISEGDKTVVVLAVTENDLTSNVSRGENSGRKLKHTAVIRYLKTIGEAAPAGGETHLAAVAIGKDWKRNDLQAVVFVQASVSRRILGVAKVSLGN